MKNELFYDDNLYISEKNPVKKIIKRFIRKSVLFLFRPYILFQNETNARLDKQDKVLKIDIENQAAAIRADFGAQTAAIKTDLENQIASMKSDLENQIMAAKKDMQKQNNLKESFIRDDIRAIARQVMLIKWQAIDSQLQEKETDILTCRICGYSQKRSDYETKETDCIFHGGHLIRYICPKCGVIFGATKFMNQSQKDIDDDYKVHYLGFSEGDSSYKEERAFFMLKPRKEGVYLNYGCGHWSASLQNLRKQGYQVYGYEPYSPFTENPYMITSREKLSKMRFDGIYSNDVLEHLLDPVEEMRFMKSLLLDTDSHMSHSTTCYVYKREYTRFHIHFFTGNSLKILCEKSGLEIIDYCNELTENDFLAYVFSAKNCNKNLLDQMFLIGGEKDAEGNVVLREKDILYGPYLILASRKYKLKIVLHGKEEDVLLKINCQYGKEILSTYNLSMGENNIEFELTKIKENLEFVIENRGAYVKVESICLS